ncbi:MAG: hypothetical protein P4L53_23725 [Candidatus Obscuribacterales bacterium]|nr:hypothetical protein [Candidatus Obscuribacterales bacterium]
MIFSSYYWGLSLLFAAISAGLTFALGYNTGSVKTKDGSGPNSTLIAGALIVFVIDLLLQRFDFYYVQPTLNGSFFGYWTPLFVASVPAIIVGNLLTGGGAALRSVLVAVLLILVPTVQTAVETVGPGNAKRFADLPQVTIADKTEKMPPTDEQHLVQVTENMAALKAKTVLSSKGNYSTLYKIGNLTLQAVKGHRYYAAPLVPTNSGDTTWTPFFGGRATSPGYVLVDAEDKEATPELHDGFHISLFEDMPFSMNLERFAYQAGYDKGDLDNATFEVDDNLQPHYTITYVTPAFGDITGRKVSKVLVVDVANEEPAIHAYAPGDAAIKWVDRVISEDLVKTYAKDWGIYGQAYSQSGFWAWASIFFDISGQDTMVPAGGNEGTMLSYTKDDHNVWVVPMTSQNSTDHGVIGVLVFETDRNKATFYPGLRGFNHGGSVIQTMFGVKDNAQTKYEIENLELYNIYGHLTWVAIYTRPQALGSTFGAVGFMDASSQEVSDVAYGQDLQTALADYTTKMGSGNGGRVANGENDTVALDGTIWRIAPNGASYRFQLIGDAKHYFDVTTQVYQGTPLLRDGDHVSGNYMDTHQALSSVRALQLVGNGPDVAAAKAADKK